MKAFWRKMRAKGVIFRDEARLEAVMSKIL